MPSIITHHIFSNEVLKKLDKKITDKMENSLIIYNTFAQSHDYLYYSNKKNIRNIGSNGHHDKTQDYLINIIKNIPI